MHSAGVDLFCQWSTKIYITDGARAGLSSIMWDKARVMIMQNAVLFLWIQAYHWGRPLKHNASKCRHELGKVGRPEGLELGKLGRPGRPGQPVVIVNLLGSNARTCGDQLKYSEMSIDINSKRWCTCWLILGSMGRIFILRVVIFAALSNLQPKNSVLSSFLEKVSKKDGVHSVHL